MVGYWEHGKNAIFCTWCIWKSDEFKYSYNHWSTNNKLSGYIK